MSIKIGKYTFEGPYTSTANLEDKSGVYAILCKKNGDKYNLVDVGESATVKSRVETHDRKDCWQRSCNSALTVAVYYTPGMQQRGRMTVEQEIRDQYDPPCGNR
jgi:hypothetical protein